MEQEGNSPTGYILKNSLYKKTTRIKERKTETDKTSSLSDLGQPCFHWFYKPLFCSVDDHGKFPFKGAYTLGYRWVIIAKYP
jgi:hypothetical protein